MRTRKTKLFYFYTSAYEGIKNEYFLPSILDDFELIPLRSKYQNIVVNYKDSDWFQITKEKAQCITDVIQENIGHIAVFSDVDIQFFKKIESYLAPLQSGFDLLIQKDNPEGLCCTGFFSLNCNKKTLRLWQDIYNSINLKNGDDQDCFDELIKKKSFIIKILSKIFPNKFFKQISQFGHNPYNIQWNYLPKEFLSGGTLTGKLWKPGVPLDIPKNIVLHHANWTVGTDNKIAQLEYVKSIVKARKSSTD